MNSGGIHGIEHVPWVGVILNAGLLVRCDEIGPIGFASYFCPDAWVFPKGGGEGMGVGVDYVVGWHWLMMGVCRVVACGLGRSYLKFNESMQVHFRNKEKLIDHAGAC